MLDLNGFAESLRLPDFDDQLLAAVEKYPNFHYMPEKAQIDCLADVMDTPLGRMLRDDLALQHHDATYSGVIDTDTAHA